MNKGTWFEWIEYWILAISCIIFIGLFYGYIVVGISRLLFDIEELTAFLVFGLPVFIVCTLIYLPKMPKFFKRPGDF